MRKLNFIIDIHLVIENHLLIFFIIIIIKNNLLKLKELLITGFNPDKLFARIDKLAEFIGSHKEKDYDSW